MNTSGANQSTSNTQNSANGDCIIAKGTIIKGVIKTTENLRIDGKIEGNIDTKGKIVIGNSGEIEGSIVTDQFESSGKVVLEKLNAKSVKLNATANFQGEIIANELTIDPGAVFNGNCKMNTGSQQAVKK